METNNNLAQKAISLAVNGQWKLAAQLNLKILDQDGQNIDALNRLAKCYFELGEINKAKKATQKVLDIDPKNSIAQKCLFKYKTAKKGVRKSGQINPPESFLEEVGKTKIIELLNLGQKDVIGSLDSGDSVKILSHRHKVSVVTMNNKYVGRLPDDLAARIRSLIKSGNKYQTLIKSSAAKGVSIFIRETVNKNNNPSFPVERLDYVSFTPPELVHKSRSVDEQLES